MGRRRKKGSLLKALAPEDWAGAAEEFGSALLGRSPLARFVSRVAGQIVYTQTGGKPQRRENKLQTTAKQPKYIKFPGGVEYLPPPKKE